MTSYCHRRRMRWSGATGAIARCKNRSTGYAPRCRSVHAWRWICGVKPKPKAVNKPSPHFIVHGLDKPGVFTTVSYPIVYSLWRAQPVQKEQTMRDNLRRYRAIRDALKQYYPGQPSGTVARHLTTLAALISAKQQARGIAARL